jgi:predicted DNA binding CopG/RHH family protein
VVSDAEVAETRYTAFTTRPKKEQVTIRLIVRRVRACNDKASEEPVDPGSVD